MFAQETIKVEEVARELDAVRDAIGSGVDVGDLPGEPSRLTGASSRVMARVYVWTSAKCPGLYASKSAYPATRSGHDSNCLCRRAVLYLNRTHPFVEGLAAYVMDTALDPLGKGAGRRCGVIRTGRVERRTTLLLVRFRYHIMTQAGDGAETALLAEDCQVLAFAGPPQGAEWLGNEATAGLPDGEPEANVASGQAAESCASRRWLQPSATPP